MRKLTHDEQVAAINKVNPNVEILGEIINARTRVLCRCVICGHEWKAEPHNLKNGTGCPKCAGKMKLSHKEQTTAIKKANPNIEILGKIINDKTKVSCRCKICGHKWSASPNTLKRGTGCAKCAGVARLSHDEQVAAITKINPNIEVLGEIKSNSAKVLCKCKVCSHEWEASPHTLKKWHGCPKCSGRVITHDEHMAAIIKANPNVEVLEKITSARGKVLTRCRICGHEWMPTPARLKKGCGCPECGKVKIGNALRLTHAEQVEAIAKINPNIEVLEEIISNSAKVLCRCKICSHEWRVAPYSIKSGVGCPRCAKYGFKRHDTGKLYIMVDDLEAPTMIKIGVSTQESRRSKDILNSAHKAGVTIPALHVAKTWEGTAELMQRIEQIMHENYAEWNIKFPAKFNGYKEFFYYTPETAEVFDIIEETYHEIINANKAA